MYTCRHGPMSADHRSLNRLGLVPLNVAWLVVPVKAGTHAASAWYELATPFSDVGMGPRFRGNDNNVRQGRNPDQQGRNYAAGFDGASAASAMIFMIV